MLKDFLYVIGQPYSGKTTLADKLTEGLAFRVWNGPFTFTSYHNGLVRLGKPGKGTDCLPLDVEPVVIEWLKAESPYSVLAEGSRLATETFFDAVRTQDYNLIVVYLDTPDKVCAERMKAVGLHRKDTWVKSQATRMKKLASKYTAPVFWIDGAVSLEEQAAPLLLLDMFGEEKSMAAL